MKTSYNGRAFIAREEGCKTYAYKDSVGVWTIGIGHTTAAGPPTVASGLRLSLAQCFDLFGTDLAKYEKRVTKAFTAPLTQAQFDAAVSFDYNTGGIDRATWVKVFNEGGDKARAANLMLTWNKPPEIRGRRKREAALFETGRYGDLSGLTVWSEPGKAPKQMPFPRSADPEPAPPPPDVQIPEAPPAKPKNIAPAAGGAAVVVGGGAVVAAQQSGLPWGWIAFGVLAAVVVGGLIYFGRAGIKALTEK